MKRKLPTYNLEGTTFIVDVDKEKLIEAANLKNVIDIGSLEDYGTHYEMRYDPKAKNRVTIFNENYDQCELVKLPQMTVLDAEGMSLKFNVILAKVQGRMDISFVIDHKMLEKRLAGDLPVIVLAGDRFIVHYKARQLRCEKGRSVINLDELQGDKNTNGYVCYYHKASGEAVYADLAHKLSPDVVPLKIPNLFALDPVAGSRHHYDSDVMLLGAYPLEMERIAIVLSKAELKEQLTSNWIKKQNSLGLISQVKKPKAKRKSRMLK